jgi:hypothetical protein
MDNRAQPSNIYVTTPNKNKNERDYTLDEQPNQ